MTVEENISVSLLAGRGKDRRLAELAYQYFPILKERRRQSAGTLSGGEQQQLAIGRAMVGNPRLMLLDEPSEGIQPSIVQMICEVLKSVRDQLGTTILFVEQSGYHPGDQRTLLCGGQGHHHRRDQPRSAAHA